MFRASFDLYVTNDLGKFNRRKEFFSNDLTNAVAITGRQFTDGWCAIVIHEECGVEAAAHEAVHGINSLFDKIGYTSDQTNDEVQAYLVGWLTSEIVEIIIQHKNNR